MREILILLTQEKIIIFNIVDKKILKYVNQISNPPILTVNTNYDRLTYAYSII